MHPRFWELFYIDFGTLRMEYEIDEERPGQDWRSKTTSNGLRDSEGPWE
jgi:hypothetical protein